MTPDERAGLSQAIANGPDDMAWPSKTVSELLDDLKTADAEFGKANARWHGERRCAAKAEIERDQARETVNAVRALVVKWGGPTTVTERFLADAIIALTGGPEAER
jgi:hypothetical protein